MIDQISVDAVIDLLNKKDIVFLKTVPETPDFTVNAPFKIIIISRTKTLEIDVNNDNIIEIISLFDATIFQKENIDRLFVWNIKSLCSYFFYFSKRFLNPTTNIFDIKILENFLGIKKPIPENYNECIYRIKEILKNKNWQNLFKNIHLPLALKVLPEIETCPLLNLEKKRCEFPYYEIEGQINGRMNSVKKYVKSYLPHNMSPDVKKSLKPKGYDLRFVCSDFRHCEVTVLQWLSKDENLKEILDSGKDLHEQIYKIITEDECDTESKRKISKKIFLPVMYGCGSNGLSNNLKISEELSNNIIERVKKRFPTAWSWMQEKQEMAKKNVIEDFFGRPRNFEEGKSYLARNFVVQGVAATACQEKLILLYNAIDKNKSHLAFSVHDGFGLICEIKYAREIYKIIKNVCEAESAVCPGLKMKVEIKFGAKLDEMKTLWKD
jgi:hypothetical protein